MVFVADHYWCWHQNKHKHTPSLLTYAVRWVAAWLSSPSGRNRTSWLRGCRHTPPTWLLLPTLWSQDHLEPVPPAGSPSHRRTLKSYPPETRWALFLGSRWWAMAQSRCIQIQWGPEIEPPPGCRRPHPWSSRAGPLGTGPSSAWSESGCLPPLRPEWWYSAGPSPQN